MLEHAPVTAQRAQVFFRSGSELVLNGLVALVYSNIASSDSAVRSRLFNSIIDREIGQWRDAITARNNSNNAT